MEQIYFLPLTHSLVAPPPFSALSLAHTCSAGPSDGGTEQLASETTTASDGALDPQLDGEAAEVGLHTIFSTSQRQHNTHCVWAGEGQAHGGVRSRSFHTIAICGIDPKVQTTALPSSIQPCLSLLASIFSTCTLL